MSKLLQKLLSAAIFPAALMIVGKLVGIYLSNRIFNLGWALETEPGRVFSVQITYPSMEAAIKCNSISNLLMYFSLLAGNAVLIFQAYFLHTSHQNPKVLVKLVQFDFIAWLAESSSLFPKLIVWTAFLWVGTIIIIAQSIQGVNYPGTAVAGFVLTLILTALTVRDIEQDIKTIFHENGKLNLAS